MRGARNSPSPAPQWLPVRSEVNPLQLNCRGVRMARSSTNDAVFGELHWKEDKWLGVVPIPYFTGAGDEVVNPLRDEVLRPWGGSRSNAEALAKRGPEQPSPDP